MEDYNGVLSPIMGTCQVMYSDEPCSKFLEYNFKDHPTWRQSQVTLDPVLQFRDKKFEIALSRQMFPIFENLIDYYRADDENTGQLIDLPHAVNGLRLWNASSR
ncbi:hypothetical protein Pmar_PMAR007488 [Perkinsus marinus ATCC 50983]|uniref:Uncharacterized protein n=1 Tax=Perkinsus marinus (strain ATCC 50983 / TXsc) TaxID=423536 RepID=C5M060_PERM5|nr:hypothetical protein Pmar_PMAR007488 [Perkinsus marinus ATCC 50983]EEQ97638.1 hypothetical protein Pmar_PMAR007488 [Perkinsus marinus ATCC 50983]|eukprot:XP_002764921.1 hypothetical protein Pmar_PMAR007488 [Perkinsus marinus ATCC 50983]